MRWAAFSHFFLPFLHILHIASAATPEDLSVEVGHHVVFSYPGPQPPPHLFDLIKQGKVGGIILFGENVADNLSSVVDEFQKTYKQSPANAGAPLLIMTDQEGGKIRRLPTGPKTTAKQVGQSKDPKEAAGQSGKDAASGLQKYKVNSNLAPVLGVYREAGDFLDHYGRSYGNSSALVGTCASSFIRSQQAAGVIAAAKHFPGLGAAPTDANTDEEPVTIHLPLRELRSIDEAPYVKAIAAGTDMVMNSWALYPSLDKKYPSGLSKAWVQDELRERLGFKGVTITDAIEAGALKAFGDHPTRAVLASKAGMDIILASARDVSQGEAIVDALVDAVKNGTLPRKTFSEASGRILAVRKKLSS
ncbi:secreted glycosyl hydrolase [Penicillium capsulatum]|uniref:Secreted glycosyl hydrolase n=1 Tax=Penicillium capsulatum TaxID=69766 RepID=A0A9W9IRI5_9EURO|nr:secreted glycosyl hydrolase [Penicillium capsulatum]KAJ6129508.1 secreted glycosyl hydrolase [Penicillium capsulatum]